MGLFDRFGKSKKKGCEPAEIYLELRQQILALEPAQVHSLLEPFAPVVGLVMETGYGTGVATLVTVADGTVSLYLSNGGGTIGLGGHEGPKTAALELLRSAGAYLSRAKPAIRFELPSEGTTSFVFLTKTGPYSATASESDLGNDRHALSPLFHKAQEVITQARLVNEAIERTSRELIGAAARGDETELRKLLDRHANPNAADPSGLTPLMAAAHGGHAHVLAPLLESGAEIDQKDSSGYTALMFACNAGELACAESLLSRGASIRAAANDGSTPIMFSAQHGHDDVVRLLMNEGADPREAGQHGLSAIGFAKQNGRTETQRILEGRG